MAMHRTNVLDLPALPEHGAMSVGAAIDGFFHHIG